MELALWDSWLPFVHSAFTYPHATPQTLITDFQEAFAQRQFNRNLVREGKETLDRKGATPFSLRLPGARPEGIQPIWSNGNSYSEGSTAAATLLRLPLSEPEVHLSFWFPFKLLCLAQTKGVLFSFFLLLPFVNLTQMSF